MKTEQTPHNSSTGQKSWSRRATREGRRKIDVLWSGDRGCSRMATRCWDITAAPSFRAA